jgi:hypothetical protein
MSYNYSLKYRTFDELLASISSDFKKYQLQNLIDPQELIKVAKRVNYDLGLRIHKTKEVILDIEKSKARLPNDFNILDFALVVGEYNIRQYLPQGTHIEEKIVGKVVPEYQQTPPAVIDLCAAPYQPADCDPLDPCGNCYDPCAPCPQCGTNMVNGICNPCCTHPESCTLSCNGDVIQLVQELTYETRYYSRIYPLRIAENNENVLNTLCPNSYWDSVMTGEIKDGWLYTSFPTGKVYLNYQGFLEDKDGNLLVPDHDGLNEYYEYAVKQRIIENLIMNDEEVSQAKIQIIEARYRIARITALSIVNTPNFKELKELYQGNRNAQYQKYYDMFLSFPRSNIR